MAAEDPIPPPPSPPGAVPITSFSVEEAVENGTFRWAPPLIERSPRPKSLYLMWRSFQEVFDQIADPALFPPLPQPLPEEDLVICRRYITAAEELAESELFCASDGMTVRIDESGKEHVSSSFTSKEITRGFSVLLRQFDSNDEPASFHRVSGRLRKWGAEMIDSHERRRCEQIDAWRKARGALHGTELRRLFIRKFEPTMEYGHEHPPTHYLSAYNYGELIHWDSGREKLAAWKQDAFDDAHTRLAFLEAATGLAYVYIGFSALVCVAIGE